MAAKPPVTPESLAKARVEQDPIAPIVDGVGAVDATAAQLAALNEGSVVNEGFEVPGSEDPEPDAPAMEPSRVLDRADRVLASAQARSHVLKDAHGAPVDASKRLPVTPASARFANEAYAPDMLDQDNEPVMDMMTSNVSRLAIVEPVRPDQFREFMAGNSEVVGQRGVVVNGEIVMEDVVKTEGQLAYEQFMNDPVTIRIHSTKDKNEAPLVFVGVNGDSRWLPRNKPIKLQRKFVERLAQAQEMAFDTKENKDPNVDNAMTITRRLAQSYEFSVLDDPSEAGRVIGKRWLARQVRAGS